MISQATQYRRPGNPLTENATYSDAIAPFFLRAAKNLTAELANRCGISTKNVIPVISDEFTFHDDPFHFDEWMKFTHIRGVKGLSTPSPRVALACIPIQFRLRLGALPVLAHEIAHFIGHTELEQKLAKGKYKSDSLTATLDELDFSVGTDLAAKALQYEAKQAWMQELIADCVAVLIMGPAYLYAFARFATGTLGEPDNKFSSTHPGFVKRLRCCLAFLKSMNFDVPFQSQFFTVGKETIGIRLARDLTSLVKRPYTADDHLNATGNVKRALQKGAVPDAPPTLILNALWDAVVRKELYVNEIASLFAIYR